jgi:hypothetical protein
LAAGRDYTKDFNITINAAFVPVSNITGVPTTGIAGALLSLSGTVTPANAANQTIAWTVKDAGTTGASISGNMLTTSGAGTAVLTATIANGLAAGTPYTQDFNITISAAAGEDQPITLSFTDEGAGAFSETSFTVKQNGDSTEQSKTITLSGTWVSREWRVDGFVKGSGTDFTVKAGDYTLGGHSLQGTVYDGTRYWSKTLQFTVTE